MQPCARAHDVSTSGLQLPGLTRLILLYILQQKYHLEHHVLVISFLPLVRACLTLQPQVHQYVNSILHLELQMLSV